MQDNLPELRDIHLPIGVSIWPPAYGWGVILLSLIVIFVLIQVFLFLRRKSKKIYAQNLLKSIDTDNIVISAQNISEILRRICIYKYKKAATLFGKDWINFLNQHSKKPLSEKSAQLLNTAPYISTDTKVFETKDVEELAEFCKNWIGENL